MKKKILVLFFKDFDKNPRGIKQYQLLKDEYEVHYAGFKDLDNRSSGEFIEIKAKFRYFNLIQKAISFLYLLLGFHKLAFKTLYDVSEVKKYMRIHTYSLIIAHDLKPLHIIYSEKGLIKNARVFLDAHEYFKGIGSGFIDAVIFRRFNLSSYKYISKVDHINTVCESIAEFYKQEFPKVDVSYTLNTPRYSNQSPSEVDKHKIKMVHHGYADPNRKLESMIETMQYTNKNIYLDLILVSLTFEQVYINKLKKLIEDMPNVRILPPLKPDEIVSGLNQYDIGFYILHDQIANMKYALPNKIFDFIQARLMVAIGPSFEMSKLVKKYDVGIVSQTFDPKEMAEIINALTPDKIYSYKENAHQAAKILNADNEMQKLMIILKKLINA